MMSQNEVLQLNYSQPRSRHRSLCILTLSGGSLYPENPGRLLESGELVVVLVTAAPRTAQDRQTTGTFSKDDFSQGAVN